MALAGGFAATHIQFVSGNAANPSERPSRMGRNSHSPLASDRAGNDYLGGNRGSLAWKVTAIL